MTYSDFEARWKPTGGAERANYSLFLQDLCDLIGVVRPDPTTDNPSEDKYVLEYPFDVSRLEGIALAKLMLFLLIWKHQRGIHLLVV